jgi:hypothetical protein
MDSRAAIASSCWIAVAISSAMYLFVAGATVCTTIMVVVLVGRLHRIIRHNLRIGRIPSEKPQANAKIQMSAEITEIKAAVNELAKKVDAIQKELAE